MLRTLLLTNERDKDHATGSRKMTICHDYSTFKKKAAERVTARLPPSSMWSSLPGSSSHRPDIRRGTFVPLLAGRYGRVVNVDCPMRVVVPTPLLERWNVVRPICVLTTPGCPLNLVYDDPPTRCVVPFTPLLKEWKLVVPIRWVVPEVPVLSLWKLVLPILFVVPLVPLLAEWNVVLPIRVLVP